MPAKKFVLQIDDPTNPDGYFEASFATMNPIMELSRNMALEFIMGVIDPSESTFDADQNPLAQPKPTRNSLTLKFEFQRDAGAADLHRMIRLAGVQKNVYLDPYPDTTDLMKSHAPGLYRFSQWDENVIDYADYWETSLTAREIIF
jgi:hypothetical protein